METIKPNFRRFHLLLQELGVDTADLYRRLGIHPRHYSDAQAGIPMRSFFQLLNLAAEESNQPALGVSMALLDRAKDLGILSYMVRNASNFEQSLELVRRYIELVVPGGRTELLRQDAICIWTYEVVGFEPELCRQDVESTLTQFCEMVRDVMPIRKWSPTRVYFQHSVTGDPDRLRRYLGNDIKFDHHFNGVAFPEVTLLHTVSDADPKLLRLLEDQVKTSIVTLQKQAALPNQVTFLISAGLGKTDISADLIARELGMSRRTLTRRLKGHSTSFRTLRNQIVMKMAKEALVTTSASIQEISHQLGFSEPSAFDRSFKAQMGVTPSAYRTTSLR